MPETLSTPANIRWLRRVSWPAAAEIALMFALLCVLGGSNPPDVNEAHYLGKAKHYWNPDWCPGDFFLDSADAHQVFYWTFGWLTLFFELPAVAWIGRSITWLGLTWGWHRITRTFAPRWGLSLASLGVFAALVVWCHMAGEWIIGGVEAKGFAYVLVFFALGEVLRNRWNIAWMLLGAATAFHVLVGGWAILCTGFGWLVMPIAKPNGESNPSILQMLPGLIAGCLLSLPGVVIGLNLTSGVPSHVIHEAYQIYVFERLPHHLVPHKFAEDFIARHLILWTIWGLMCCLLPAARRATAPISGIVLGTGIVALAGLAIDLALKNQPELAAPILRYYFFRLSDIFLPLGVATLLAAQLVRLHRSHPVSARWLLTAMYTCSFLLCVQSVRIRGLRDDSPAERQSEIYDVELWRDVCRWIDENTPADAIFLTPKYQQSFKWLANRSEVVTAKDIPQDAYGIVGWRQRLLDCHTAKFSKMERYTVLTAAELGEQALLDLSRDYGFQYIVVDESKPRGFGLEPIRLAFPVVYVNNRDGVDTYVVYRVRE